METVILYNDYQNPLCLSVSPLKNTLWELDPSPTCEEYELSKSSEALGSFSLKASLCSPRVLLHPRRFIILSLFLMSPSFPYLSFCLCFCFKFKFLRPSLTQFMWACFCFFHPRPTLHPNLPSPSGLLFQALKPFLILPSHMPSIWS